ncbi:MAG: hypothetical protein JWM78_2932 [Verrucomicrobiaceae bacterium]|nr:hypothetical protein [Verrucomicrobiaceae bacterium]
MVAREKVAEEKVAINKLEGFYSELSCRLDNFERQYDWRDGSFVKIWRGFFRSVNSHAFAGRAW